MNTFKVSKRQLVTAITTTAILCDRESCRFSLGGVLIEQDKAGTGFNFVGTDGRRLGVYHMPAQVSNRSDMEGFFKGGTAVDQVILDGQHLLNMAKRLENKTASDTVTVTPHVKVDNKKMGKGTAYTFSWTANSRKMTAQARVEEGRFPKWRDVIPSIDTAVGRAIGHRNRWVASLGKAVEPCNTYEYRVDLNGAVTLKRDEVKVGGVEYSGRALAPRFNVSYLHEWLAALPALPENKGSENVEARFYGEDRPAMFTAQDGILTYIVMPLSPPE